MLAMQRAITRSVESLRVRSMGLGALEAGLAREAEGIRRRMLGPNVALDASRLSHHLVGGLGLGGLGDLTASLTATHRSLLRSGIGPDLLRASRTMFGVHAAVGTADLGLRLQDDLARVLRQYAGGSAVRAVRQSAARFDADEDGWQDLMAATAVEVSEEEVAGEVDPTLSPLIAEELAVTLAAVGGAAAAPGEDDAWTFASIAVAVWEKVRATVPDLNSQRDATIFNAVVGALLVVLGAYLSAHLSAPDARKTQERLREIKEQVADVRKELADRPAAGSPPPLRLEALAPRPLREDHHARARQIDSLVPGEVVTKVTEFGSWLYVIVEGKLGPGGAPRRGWVYYRLLRPIPPGEAAAAAPTVPGAAPADGGVRP